jgi:hypothetical protein
MIVADSRARAFFPPVQFQRGARREVRAEVRAVVGLTSLRPHPQCDRRARSLPALCSPGRFANRKNSRSPWRGSDRATRLYAFPRRVRLRRWKQCSTVTCKTVDGRLSDRKEKIRPFVLSNVPYQAERRGCRLRRGAVRPIQPPNMRAVPASRLWLIVLCAVADFKPERPPRAAKSCLVSLHPLDAEPDWEDNTAGAVLRSR